MSYYLQGDFYRGDFYRGDPGFLSFLKKGAGLAASFLPGVGGAVGKLISKLPMPAKKAVIRAGETVMKHPVMTAAGAAGAAVGIAGGTLAEQLHKRGSAAAAGMGRMQMGGAGAMRAGGRRHRRMRVTNTKALRRALRRAYGFEKIAMRTIHLLHPKKKARFGGFRKRHRKA